MPVEIPSEVTLPTGTVTFVFTDIEGSTRLLQRVGPAFGEVLERHGRLIRDAVARNGGRVVNTEGDGFFLVFTLAGDALSAVEGIQRKMFESSWPEGTSVRVRVGLHTGAAELGGSDYTGIDVHRAARIADAAHGGQTLISAATRALLDGVSPTTGFKDLGEHRLRGLDTSEHLYQVVISGLPADFPPLRTQEARPNNLPVQSTPFIGRSSQVSEILDLLERERLLTLTGAGGTGKTRLALQAGSEALQSFPDGVFLVRLDSIKDPELIVSTVARAVGIVEGGDRPVAEVLSEYLGSRRLLLILDNCEHLRRGMSRVGELMASAAYITILATSRSPLGLSGEHEYPVPPLEVPEGGEELDAGSLERSEGMSLFVSRARESDPGFSLTLENAGTLAEIVRRLDGLPLALELAARRLKVLTPDELLARLADRLSILTSGPSDAPDRHQTLRAAIEWSHDQLDETGKAFFRRLGVFSGSFGLEAAEAVAGGLPVHDVLSAVASVVDESLLRRRIELRQESRFEMLETVKAYALDRLRESGEERRVVKAHRDYFVDLARRAGEGMARERQGLWLERLELDHDDLRVVLRDAIASGDPDTGLVMGHRLWRFWQLKGHLEEGRAWLEELLEVPGSSAAGRAAGLIALAGLAYWQGDVDKAGQLYEEVLPLSRELEDHEKTHEAMVSLAILALFRHDFETADAILDEAENVAGELGAGSGTSAWFAAVGMSRLLQGDPEGALGIFEENVERMRAHENEWWLGQALVLRVRAELALERHGQAQTTVREAIRAFHSSGELSGLAQAFDWLGLVSVSEGELDRGLRLAGAAQAVRDRMGIGLTLPVRGLPSPRETAREKLSEEEIGRIFEEGRSMSLDEAIAFARDED